MRLIGYVCEVELPDMISVAQIREMIQQLTTSKLTLDVFEDWLVATSWNMHKANVPAGTAEIVGQIELCLAESEHKTETQLIWELAAIGGVFRMGEPGCVAVVAEGATPNTVPLKCRIELSADADKQREKEFSYTLLQPA